MMVVVVLHCFIFFFFKQKTAYEMSISDWSSTCALPILGRCGANLGEQVRLAKGRGTGECHHMLREHVERAGAKAVGVALARLHGVQGRPRLQLFEAVAGHDQRAARPVEPVVGAEIGRASFRERVWQYVENSVVAE